MHGNGKGEVAGRLGQRSTPPSVLIVIVNFCINRSNPTAECPTKAPALGSGYADLRTYYRIDRRMPHSIRSATHHSGRLRPPTEMVSSRGLRQDLLQRC